ncbi:MAG: gfo/Idh/MocA family oxidoreductase, partial [Chthonomonadales bacterium]
RTNFDPNGRLFDPLLGGGALLDVGIYPISLSSMIFGEPDRITGLATMCETGVDEQSAFLLGHPGGSISVLSTAVRTETPHTAVIMGTEGMITIPAPFWKPQGLIIQRAGKPEERIDLPTDSTGFQFEAAHVAECLREGRIESPVIPLSESLSIMRTLDTLRAQWGLTYPTEQA